EGAARLLRWARDAARAPDNRGAGCRGTQDLNRDPGRANRQRAADHDYFGGVDIPGAACSGDDASQRSAQRRVELPPHEHCSRGSVAYYERELRDLVRINYVEPHQSALAAVARGTQGAAALGHAEYFAELIDEWAPEGHADERLYRLGASVIDALAAGASIEPL